MTLSQKLYDQLNLIDGVILYTKRPEKRWSVPVISFNINNLDSEEVSEILNRKFNIAVRAGLHCAPLAHKSFGTIETGTVRAVVSTFTTVNDINYFANSVRKICYDNKIKKRN